MTIAIIGAGMAGISCAQHLMQAGIEVHCFDKARGPSGRMASRRHDLGACDHGAQYFTAKDRGFRRQVEAWCALGAVAPWPGRVGHWQDGAIHADREATTRYVGTPRMSACLRAASESLPLSTGCQISSLHQDDAGAWWCTDTNQHQHGPFTQLLCTAPAPQAAALLPKAHPLLDPLSQVEMAPCWALMLWLDADIPLDWDAIRLHHHPCLDWISREHLRPGRQGTARLVIHATAQWSQAHLEDSPEAVTDVLQEAVASVLGVSLAPQARQAHRWRYARPLHCLGRPCLYDPASAVGLAGDWCLDARIEAAWLSGAALGLLASQHHQRTQEG